MKLTLLLLSCLTVVQGFSVVSPSSRRQLLDAAAASLAGSVLLPHAAHADVTNKVASSTAIRGVKRAQKLIDALELYVVNDQYLELMAAIREPPFPRFARHAPRWSVGRRWHGCRKTGFFVPKLYFIVRKVVHYGWIRCQGQKAERWRAIGSLQGQCHGIGKFCGCCGRLLDHTVAV
ncbi:hypothetical protein MHU86_21033 [Fragilaria crotonensis]|nr:hypothetical protein MHU86_21033 [Fragilaria crotonensis]